MEKAKNTGREANTKTQSLFIKDNSMTEKEMGSEASKFIIALEKQLFILANSLMETNMEKENKLMKVDLSMKDNGKITDGMVLES